MNAQLLHAGFDGLKFTVMAYIPSDLRSVLFDAKAMATRCNCEIPIELGKIELAVRRSGGMAFSAHTGEYGAEWYFLDPQNRPDNNPGITVDFRAFLLATGGLEAAEAHFRECMDAFGIPYTARQVRASRVDFAIDMLAPWFVPNRDSLIVPPGTKVKEITGVDETETHSVGSRVVGLRAGAVAGRQLVIYDKRLEVIQKQKHGWLAIWNHFLEKNGLPPLDLKDRDASQVWRFELRMGSKQLRNRWAMQGWQDLGEKVGDAFAEFCERMRYTSPTADSNRARWPAHPLWQQVEKAASEAWEAHRIGVCADEVKYSNRTAHQQMLDRQTLGLLVSRAAASDVSPEDFEAFAHKQVQHILDLSHDHPKPLAERLSKAQSRYRFR